MDDLGVYTPIFGNPHMDSQAVRIFAAQTKRLESSNWISEGSWIQTASWLIVNHGTYFAKSRTLGRRSPTEVGTGRLRTESMMNFLA